MIKIFVENKPFQVDPNRNLLDICLSLGFNVPYFCWHQALGSVGACRQCAVKVYKDIDDRKGQIVMACMTKPHEMMLVYVDDKEAIAFRKSIIEWLMTNHPHDCPVCDEGGECHLQDMTVLVGHEYRRHRFPKRTYRNQDLGPFINHEMNRCIQCYRCVRFYRDYAGGKDLDAFGSSNRIYFGRFEEGALESEFSGNLVEICPTGVFTDKTLKAHYSRKWDLQMAPSICSHCSLGCNTTVGEREGKVRRVLNRYHGNINRYFICDRGRFGYEFANGEQRLRELMIKSRQTLRLAQISQSDFWRQFIKEIDPNARLIGIGSPRASLESNYALRTLVGSSRFFSGISAEEQKLLNLIIDYLKNGPVKAATIEEIEQSDAVLVLGEDLTQTAPRLALAVRQSVRQQSMEMARKLDIPEWHDNAVRYAAQNKRGALYLAITHSTKLDDVAAETYCGAPQDLARLALAVAHNINSDAPPVPDLSDDVAALAERISLQLKKADCPAIITGVSAMNEALLKAGMNVATALERKAGKVCFVLPECNSLGLGLLNGKPLSELDETMNHDGTNVLIVMENDLTYRVEKGMFETILQDANVFIALDSGSTRTVDQASFFFPSGTVFETSGTFVNNEGRMQRFFQVTSPEVSMPASWRWLDEIRGALGQASQTQWNNLDDIVTEIAEKVEELESIIDAAPGADFRIHAQKIPRQPHRYSGRTSINAKQNIHEPKQPDDNDSPLSFTMEGFRGRTPASLMPFYWSPGWNSIQALNKFQEEINGPIHAADAGIRLFEPKKDATFHFYQQIPSPFERREGQVLLLPVHHIYGSDELSSLATALKTRIPDAYIALSPATVEKMSIESGDSVDLTIGGFEYLLPVKVNTGLPEGLAGIPIGIVVKHAAFLRTWTKLERIEGWKGDE